MEKKKTKRIICHKSQASIHRNLRELRAFIDNGRTNFIEARIAYAMETAVRWAIEDTTNWKGLAEEACLQADILKKELLESVQAGLKE